MALLAAGAIVTVAAGGGGIYLARRAWRKTQDLFSGEDPAEQKVLEFRVQRVRNGK